MNVVLMISYNVQILLNLDASDGVIGVGELIACANDICISMDYSNTESKLQETYLVIILVHAVQSLYCSPGKA